MQNIYLTICYMQVSITKIQNNITRKHIQRIIILKNYVILNTIGYFRKSSNTVFFTAFSPLGGLCAHTRKNNNLGGDIAQRPASLPEIKSLAITIQKHAKVDIKLFLSPPVLPDFSILCQIFCPGL